MDTYIHTHARVCKHTSDWVADRERSMLEFVELLRRLEWFLKDSCADYHSSPFNWVMVMGLYVPYVLYGYAVYKSLTARSLYWVVMSKGLLLTSIAMLITRWALPTMNASGLCKNRLEMRPCNEAALNGFLIVYYMTWVVMITTKRNRNHIGMFAFLFLVGVTGFWSQSHLKLFTHLEVFLGAIVGVLTATITVVLLYKFMVPRLHTPTAQYYMDLFGIKGHDLRATRMMPANPKREVRFDVV